MRISDWSSDVCSSDLSAIKVAMDPRGWRQAGTSAAAAVECRRTSETGQGEKQKTEDRAALAQWSVGASGCGGFDHGQHGDSPADRRRTWLRTGVHYYRRGGHGWTMGRAAFRRGGG